MTSLCYTSKKWLLSVSIKGITTLVIQRRFSETPNRRVNMTVFSAAFAMFICGILSWFLASLPTIKLQKFKCSVNRNLLALWKLFFHSLFSSLYSHSLSLSVTPDVLLVLLLCWFLKTKKKHVECCVGLKQALKVIEGTNTSKASRVEQVVENNGQVIIYIQVSLKMTKGTAVKFFFV